ncbi:hypothetical protein CDAR_438661 [Caerostris darwini]|uniref:Uncharacterized protein n=1 Tax=Caerostris darwini TaxID=1538125 RepID=A0AAV4X104_9ARAC|nr:hypothetical protein CDAR_438661 [Caerostris darwini]
MINKCLDYQASKSGLTCPKCSYNVILTRTFLGRMSKGHGPPLNALNGKGVIVCRNTPRALYWITIFCKDPFAYIPLRYVRDTPI